MTIRTIVTHVEPGTDQEVQQRAGPSLALARLFSAHLTALAFTTEVVGANASPPNDDPAIIERQTAAAISREAARLGVDCEVRGRSSFAYGIGDALVDQIMVSDMASMTTRVQQTVAQRMLLTSAVFDSGRPLLLLPAGTTFRDSPLRVVVAWDATPAAVRAVHALLAFIPTGSEVTIATVTHDKTIRSGQSGIELTHLIARHGHKATFAPVQQQGLGVLEALLLKARELEADMLVMGCVRHSPLRNFIFGSATTRLFEGKTALPILVSA